MHNIFRLRYIYIYISIYIYIYIYIYTLKVEKPAVAEAKLEAPQGGIDPKITGIEL